MGFFLAGRSEIENNGQDHPFLPPLHLQDSPLVLGLELSRAQGRAVESWKRWMMEEEIICNRLQSEIELVAVTYFLSPSYDIRLLPQSTLDFISNMKSSHG